MIADEVLEHLRNDISTLEYERYIKQLSYKEEFSKNDLAVFSVPNVLVANWIKTKYSEKISYFFELVNKVKPKIKIILEEQVKKHDVHQFTHKDEQEQKNLNQGNLNPSYTFESFVVGDSNKVAYQVAQSISQKPGIAYNPVFIYGPTGLGKTHLIQAVGNYAQSKNKIVIYTTSEQFLNDYIYNMKNKTMDRFQDKYRKCDLLLIDDVQFLANKVQTQEEFFHTFNELHENKKQIVLTSDKPPKMINGLEERLRSRFEWGMTADITQPELETKIAIIRKKCEIDSIQLTPDIIEYIASHMGENIREIESAIISLNAYATMMRQEITIEFAKNVLKEQLKQQRENISLEDIIKIVSRELNVKSSDIKSKKRTKNIVEARKIGIYLARTLTPNSMPSLASYFGLKDHSSVSKNLKQINELLMKDEYFKLRVEELKNIVLTKGQD